MVSSREASVHELALRPQELSLLAGGGGLLRSASEGGGVAQFPSAMSAAPPEEASGSAAWNARYNTFPAASSMPVGSALLPIRSVPVPQMCIVQKSAMCAHLTCSGFG